MMAPWDELRYFRLPVEKQTTISSGPTKIVDRDPMRVWLMISTGTGTVIYVSTLPGATATEGIASAQQTPVILSARDSPGLVQSSWYVNAVGGTMVNSIELSMLAWPDDPAAAAAVRDRIGSGAAAAIGRMRGQQSRVERMAELVRMINDGRT